MKYILVALFTVWLCTDLWGVQSHAELDPDLDTLCAWLPGMYYNTEQHHRDTSVPLVHLSIVKIWPERTGGCFYQVQLMHVGAKAPLLAWIMHVRRVEEGMIECLLYASAEADSPQNTLLGCEWYLQATGESFVGGSHGYACAPEPTITYLTTEVEVRSFGIRLLMQGFDANHRRVWGVADKPILFVREETIPASNSPESDLIGVPGKE